MGQDPEKEASHLASKPPVSRNHPGGPMNLFGQVSEPGLKPKGLIHAIGDLAQQVVPVSHGTPPVRPEAIIRPQSTLDRQAVKTIG